MDARLGEEPNLRRYLRTLYALLLIFTLWASGRALYPDPAIFRPAVSWAAHRYRVDPKLLLAVIRTESHFDVTAISPRGAVGLMQIMPDTGRWLWPKVYGDARYDRAYLRDPEVNIHLGAYYLGFLMKTFNHNTSLALAAYNGGAANVRRWVRSGNQTNRTFLATVSYPETKRFVMKVWVAYVLYHVLYPWT